MKKPHPVAEAEDLGNAVLDKRRTFLIFAQAKSTDGILIRGVSLIRIVSVAVLMRKLSKSGWLGKNVQYRAMMAG